MADFDAEFEYKISDNTQLTGFTSGTPAATYYCEITEYLNEDTLNITYKTYNKKIKLVGQLYPRYDFNSSYGGENNS